MKVNLTDIFTSEFLQKYTVWKEWNEFEQKAPLEVHKEYYWPYINNPEFNQYISNHSEFPTWSSMVRQATQEYMAVRIGA